MHSRVKLLGGPHPHLRIQTTTWQRCPQAIIHRSENYLGTFSPTKSFNITGLKKNIKTAHKPNAKVVSRNLCGKRFRGSGNLPAHKSQSKDWRLQRYSIVECVQFSILGRLQQVRSGDQTRQAYTASSAPPCPMMKKLIPFQIKEPTYGNIGNPAPMGDRWLGLDIPRC